jgi:hypothetical protein
MLLAECWRHTQEIMVEILKKKSSREVEADWRAALQKGRVQFISLVFDK